MAYCRSSRIFVIYRLPLGAAFCALLLGSLCAQCQDLTRTVAGEVRTTDSKPLPSDVTVRLEKAEGVLVEQRFLGSDGKFRFDNLNESIYDLVVTAKGFQTVRQVVDMEFLGTRYTTIYLVPSGDKKSALPPSDAPLATDLAAPKKAKQEFEKGFSALQERRYDEARKHLGKAVAEDPCYARAQTALGIALSMQHQNALAESAFYKSIKCDGAFLDAYLQLSVLLIFEGKRAEDEAMLQQGLRRFPDQWQIYYQLGTAHGGMGKYEEAEADFLKVEAMNPSPLPEIHLKLGAVYLRRQEYEKSYAEMQAYLRADPNSRYADQTRAQMRELESSGKIKTFSPQTNASPK